MKHLIFSSLNSSEKIAGLLVEGSSQSENKDQHVIAKSNFYIKC